MASSRLHHNVLYNILGSLVPIVIAVVTIPVYIRVIGEARYGLLSLIWLAFGYFGIFDLGLSRATAHRLAALRGRPLADRASVFYTACSLNLALGFTAGALFYIVAVPLAGHFTHDAALHQEVLEALPLIAAFFPVGLLGGVLAGCLQADERFLELNLQQSVGSVLMQCLPLVFVHLWQNDLAAAVLGAIIARCFNVAWLALVCLKWAYGAGRPQVRKHHIPKLFKYGGWITISDMVAPVLNGFDQMVIGMMLGPSAAAHYSVPYNMASKALILPAALNSAIFPRLSGMNAADAQQISKKSLFMMAGVMALICVPAILLAHPVLRLWIGNDFALASHLPASILLVGMWFNSIGYVPFTYLQAQGRPDLVAKIHALELIPFFAFLVVMIELFGLNGAAIAWTVRIIVDVFLQASVAKFDWVIGSYLTVPASAICLALVVAFLQPNDWYLLLLAIVIEGCLFAWTLLQDDFRHNIGRLVQRPG